MRASIATCRPTGVICFFVVGAALLGDASICAQLAQTESPRAQAEHTGKQEENYTLHVKSDLVVLDVVVTDSKGQPVSGLTKNDIRVYENDVPEQIVSLQGTGYDDAGIRQTVAVDSTAELDEKEPDAPVSIIVLDELTTTFEDRYFARYSLEKYLANQGETLQQPIMLVARNLKHMMQLQDFTTSKRELLTAVQNHLAGNDWQAKDPDNASDQFVTAFASLIELAEATQGHRGHKNVIWIGRGFPELHWQGIPDGQQEALRAAIADCTNILRDSRITLYTVEPGGLATSSELTMNSDGEFDFSEKSGGQVDFEAIAQATGGQALHGRNDVDRMIGTSLRNGSNFYTLSYRPAPGSQDEKPNQFRKIRVVPVNSGYIATTRTGYFSGGSSDDLIQGDKAGLTNTSGADGMSPKERFDLAAACNGLMVFDGISLKIVRDEHAPNLYHVSFPAGQLGLIENDKTAAGDVKLLLLGYDSRGKLIHSTGQSIHIRLPQGSSEEDRMVTLNATVDMPPTVARVRVVVRANNSGRLGADNVFLAERNTLKDPATGVKASEGPKVR